jgi:hypothetical protein
LIRIYEESDFDAVKEIHLRSGLPPNCAPNPANKLFITKIVADEDGQIVQAGFVKLTGEAYVLVDHKFGTPEKRWDILQSLVIRGLHDAGARGLSDVSCWLPPSLEQSFAVRLKALGFEKSPWNSYTAILE